MKALQIVLILLTLGYSDKICAQKYTPPQYKSGPGEFSQYLRKYARLSDILPTNKDYFETYTYTLYISKDGTLKFANVLGKDMDIRTEIKRVIRLSDKWQPAMLNSVAIDTTVSDTLYVCSSINANKACAAYDSLRTIQYYKLSLLAETSSREEQAERTVTAIRAMVGTKLFNKGIAFNQTKDYQKALESFEGALANFYFPKHEVLMNMAVCYFQLNQNEKACEYFLEAARYGDKKSEEVYKQKCK